MAPTTVQNGNGSVGQELSKAVDEIDVQLTLSKDVLEKILERFHERMFFGLANDNQNMLMIPTFVTGVPDGSEQGTYLALDLGGTNLRVCEVILDGKGSFTMKQQKYKVSDELKRGKAKTLFTFIAQSVKTFLESESNSGSPSSNEELLLGFTFSFPCEQTAIDQGTLIKWTKGFDADDAIGQEVVGLLQSCLNELGVKVRVNSLVNDTVGTLLAHGYQSKGPALLGGIFGTGTNGAYVELRKNITKLQVDDPLEPAPTYMIVNAEWGGFDDERAVLPVTPFDNQVDREAIRPRHHAFEKMISGMYLGEIARMIILSLVDRLLLFKGFSSVKMNSQYAFDTAYLSTIMDDKKDASDKSSPTFKVLAETMEIKAENISAEDVEAVRRVCNIVGKRAARLSAVAVAAVIKHHQEEVSPDNKEEVYNLGVDGSVVEYLPNFLDWVREALREMVGTETEKKTQFGFAKDGSGIGAALCALQASKQERGHHHPHLHKN
jgi:hexokinase